jgi:hypothetical protein
VPFAYLALASKAFYPDKRLFGISRQANRSCGFMIVLAIACRKPIVGDNGDYRSLSQVEIDGGIENIDIYL